MRGVQPGDLGAQLADLGGQRLDLSHGTSISVRTPRSGRIGSTRGGKAGAGGGGGGGRPRRPPAGVIARTAAVIEPGGVLGELACEPPLTLRQVHSDIRGCCELRLVGTAAGPLAGDDLSISLQLRAGAHASLRATGASLAQGRGCRETSDRDGRGSGAARLAIRADLADRSCLVADPGPLIVCAGSRVHVRVELALGAGAAVEWRELIVLGRTGEPPGAVTLGWDVTRQGRPVLRQFTDLGDEALTGWAGLTAHRRVLACALIADPAAVARTAVASATSVAQRVDDQTLLVTVLHDDAAAALSELDGLCATARR
jgi:urease accessory protein